jgi:YggT family protein
MSQAVIWTISFADYVNALFVVYFVMILINILLSFVPRMPYYPWLRAILDFITESTNPYLNVFRRMTRPIGSGEMSFDIAPILAIFALIIAQAIIVGALLR